MNTLEVVSIQHISLFIAVLAMFFTGWSSWATRKHNRLSVRPVIDSWVHRNEDDKDRHILVWIQNKGFGTGKVLSWDLLLNGRIVTEEVLIKDIETEFKGYFSISDFGEMTPNSYIAKDEKVTVLRVSVTDKFNNELVDKFDSRYSLQINYESLYGDEYTYESYPS